MDGPGLGVDAARSLGMMGHHAQSRSTSSILLLVLLVILDLASPASALYSSKRKLQLREQTRSLFHHSYDAYKRHAYPMDELKPLSCQGVGVNRTHQNVFDNDVFGDFQLTLVDTLDTFAILGEKDKFEQGVKEVIETVSFDKDAKVQVFEVTIRMLSSHILATSRTRGFYLPWYRNEMLNLADDLGRRLLPAFKTRTGIPYARVHLRHGVRMFESTETCSAGAGSLLLEFATLSRLTGKKIYEEKAKKAFFAVWNQKSDLGLVGNTIMGNDGKWLVTASSTGAGIDSIFEYAAKSYILLGDDEYLRVWNDMYAAIMKHLRAPDGFWYRPVNMYTGQIVNFQVDSLSAFFPGLQTLVGDLEAAIKAHAVYAFQWKRYHALPEVFDISKRTAVNLVYPLRPEFIESNYHLYRATKDEWYLEMAEEILKDLVSRVKVTCGAASLLNVISGQREDKMPSFFTSETLKYLYLTFDEGNPWNHDDSSMVFSTEAHMLELVDRPKPKKKRRKPSKSKASPSTPTKKSSSTGSLRAPVCPRYDPVATNKHQHYLLTSVGNRIDFEQARYLVGYDIDAWSEKQMIRRGLWSHDGWCETGVMEAYVIELVFSHNVADEIISPGPDVVQSLSPPPPGKPVKRSFQQNDRLIIHRVHGLRFVLTRTGTPTSGPEQYRVSRVGPYKVASGQTIVIDDPIVLAKVLPANRPGRAQLRVELTEPPINVAKSTMMPGAQSPAPQPARTIMTLLGIAASFGPTLNDPILPFSFSQPSIPLLLLPSSPFGCSFQSLTADVPHTSLRGHVLLLHRGECNFIAKAAAAHQVGALGVIVINSPGQLDDGLIPSAEPEEVAQYQGGLVPLIIVSHQSGERLESLLQKGGSADEVAWDQIYVRIKVEERELLKVAASKDEDTKAVLTPMFLGGYQVMNVKLATREEPKSGGGGKSAKGKRT
ncbi:BQ2448_7675 [Microbotryum intermedium]|uniref:alpha-1,2-Mannosidase n=1 Tax=Microbotryum intermedium TaxID=269621 RepID=A0A238FUA0_9BASI|nr:BQ2448_7675 [Microbotryum intermedium]